MSEPLAWKLDGHLWTLTASVVAEQKYLTIYKLLMITKGNTFKEGKERRWKKFKSPLKHFFFLIISMTNYTTMILKMLIILPPAKMYYVL